MQTQRYNPPGLGQQQQARNYVERPIIIPFEYDNVPANEAVTGLFQLIDNDADFFWRGVTASSTNNAFFGVRLQDANGYYLSDGFVSGFVLSSFYIANPFSFVPALLCPAGSKITIDLQDQSGSGVSVLLNFIGVKRYYV